MNNDSQIKENANQKLNDFKVGNIVTLGNYKGKGPIEWQVLEVKDNKALLLSKHILFRKAYDKNGSGIWKTSSLRQYLNGKFYENCFTKREKNAIILSSLKVNTGDTEDRLYLLSVEEVNKYFNSDKEREAVDFNEHGSSWFLRCRGYRDHYVECVTGFGYVGFFGNRADYDRGGVRVALQWNLES